MSVELNKENWIVLGQVGLSSKTIWSHFTLNAAPGWPSEPLDPSDFLRCYWLLKLAPEWRARIGELGDRYPRWKGLAENWDGLEAMLLAAWPKCCESGTYQDEPPAKAMYERMQVLRSEDEVVMKWPRGGPQEVENV